MLLLGLISCSEGDRAERLECIAPANPGGGWDLTCRTIASAFRELDIAPGVMRVRNIPGAGGGVAYANVVTQQSGNSGIVVAASPSTTLGIAQGQFGDFDEEDVRWIAAVGAEPGVVAIKQDAPWETLHDFVEAWRADPGSIAVGGGSAIGGQDHMKALVLARTVGVPVDQVLYVPFDGGGEALTALIGGFIHMVPGEGSEIRGQLEGGNIRLLAVLGSEREAGMLANTPTARELGYDMEWIVWRGFYSPPEISDEAYRLWIERFESMVSSDQWPELLARNGLSPYFLAGDAFRDLVVQQTAEFRTLSRDIGVLP